MFLKGREGKGREKSQLEKFKLSNLIHKINKKEKNISRAYNLLQSLYIITVERMPESLFHFV